LETQPAANVDEVAAFRELRTGSAIGVGEPDRFRTNSRVARAIMFAAAKDPASSMPAVNSPQLLAIPR
jgi:hypothetical protein